MNDQNRKLRILLIALIVFSFLNLIADFTFVSAVLFIGLVALFFLGQRSESDLEHQLEEAENKNKTLIDQQASSHKKRVHQQAVISETKSLVHVLCHDLSNSLTVIIGAAGKGKSGKPMDEEKQVAMWNRVYKAAISQRELIGQVRDMERLKTGKARLHLQSLDLHEFVEKSVFIFETKLKEKGIELVNKLEPKQIFAIAEKSSISNNVLNNIISNAIKFSPQNGKIFIEASKEGENVYLRVKDQGIGMPESIKKNLFSLNAQTSREGTQGEQGTGFGMPLVATYMDHYGGSINVKSVEKDDESQEHGTEMILCFRKEIKEPVDES